jgi:hypothetical protein
MDGNPTQSAANELPDAEEHSLQHDDEAVPGKWVEEHAGTPQEERVARLTADQDLILRVQLEGFGGSTWAGLSRALAEYGYPVMRAWVRTGRVFRYCRLKGIRVRKPPEDGFDFSVADDLSTHSVALGLTNFQNRIIPQSKWDPSKGARLTTYFVGQCLIQFPTAYEEWSRTARREMAVAGAVATYPPQLVTPEASRQVELKAAEKDLLNRIPDALTRDIVRLKADGWSHAEISEALQVSEGTLEGRLYRLRRRKDL